MAKSRSVFEEQKAKMMSRAYIGTGAAILLLIVFVTRIVILQNTDVDRFKDNYINKNYREATLKAARGNLYAVDGSILATTVMRYNIYLDFKTMRDTL